MDNAWSLTERAGWLRLKTNRMVPNIFLAPNTLTQRMEGPTCSGVVKMDISKMKDGDCAGFATFNDQTGALAIRKQGSKAVLQFEEWGVKLTPKDKTVEKENVSEKVIESVALDKKQTTVWLRIDGDDRPGERGGKDAANFYYSLDGEQWTKIGTNDYKMRFNWQQFFMGSKFAIFNFATKKAGGWVDVDSFAYSVEEK